MGFSLELALRYMSSKKRAFISVGTLFAVVGVSLGVAALTTVMSVTGGFRSQFRDKVLGVNAHVLILKRSSDFSDYRELMDQMKDVPGVTGIAPFTINPMMVTHGERTATGVLLKGVDPELMPKVLDLPRHIRDGSLQGMRKAGARPPEAPSDPFSSGGGWDSKKGFEPALDADAGSTGLLDAIEKQIAEDRARDSLADAGTTDLATLIATGAGAEIAAQKARRPPVEPMRVAANRE